MSTESVTVFRKTVAKSDQWLQQIMDELDWDDQQRAYKALRVVLHTLRDRLTVEEATDLSAQLPMLLRGMFFEGWNPTGKPVKMRKAQEFVEKVNSEFDPKHDRYQQSEEITKAVLRVVARNVSDGEIKDIVRSLPENMWYLWIE